MKRSFMFGVCSDSTSQCHPVRSSNTLVQFLICTHTLQIMGRPRRCTRRTHCFARATRVRATRTHFFGLIWHERAPVQLEVIQVRLRLGSSWHTTGGHGRHGGHGADSDQSRRGYGADSAESRREHAWYQCLGCRQTWSTLFALGQHTGSPYLR